VHSHKAIIFIAMCQMHASLRFPATWSMLPFSALSFTEHRVFQFTGIREDHLTFSWFEGPWV